MQFAQVWIVVIYSCSLQSLPLKCMFVYVIGGSVVLFGKNRVLKLAVVNKIVRA